MLIRLNCILFFGLKLYLLILKNSFLNPFKNLKSKSHLIEVKKNWLKVSWKNMRKNIISFSLKKWYVFFAVPPATFLWIHLSTLCCEHQISKKNTEKNIKWAKII